MSTVVKAPHERTFKCVSRIMEVYNTWAPGAYKDAESGTLRAKLSSGNDKIGRTFNISLPPVISCGNCSVCKDNCYAVGLYFTRYNSDTSAAHLWTRNHVRFLTDPDGYFNDIDEQLTAYEKETADNLARFGYTIPAGTWYYFRWHVSGEICKNKNINGDAGARYLQGMKYIARKHPGCKFLAFTKMYDVVNASPVMPANLQIVFSRWYGVPCNNPYHFPECYVNFADPSKNEFYHIPEADRHYCTGDCELCNATASGCWHLLPGQASVINQH